ncbi:putative 1-phosphatidylinositol 4-kinase [Helianthus debilis subsp. tardiflorus]
MSIVDVALTPVLKKSGSGCFGSSESIVIYITVGGLVIPMRVMESDSIGTVKHRIQTCNGFVVKKQKLVFGGRELSRNNSLVRDYGVCSGDVLHLIIGVSDLLVITVETAVGEEFEFEVDRFRNVKYLKQLVLEKAKGVGLIIDIEDHEILCNGEKLDDHRLIDDICNNHDAVVHLVVERSTDVVYNSDDRNLVEEEINLKKPPDIDSPLQAVTVGPSRELSSTISSMVDSAFEGLRKGRKPIRSSEGTGGTYFMQHPSGNRYAAVFKPIDEEPMAVNNPQGLPVSKNGEGLKRGTKVGEGALREVAAYILDHPKGGPRGSGDTETGFAGVPPTVMAKCLNGEFNHPKGYDGGPGNVKLGSLQMFMKNCGSCEDMGPRDFPGEEVHKIAVFDIRTANADRHAGNILMNREGDRVVLIPIDHGYCLPENFEDCTFDWLYWPQAREPFSRETVDYIQTLDAEQDLALLSSNGWDLSFECARTLRVSTMLLKKGASRGLSPYTIGRILCRETLNEESIIEKILQKASSIRIPGTTEAEFLAIVSDLLDFELDKVSGKHDL